MSVSHLYVFQETISQKTIKGILEKYGDIKNGSILYIKNIHFKGVIMIWWLWRRVFLLGVTHLQVIK